MGPTTPRADGDRPGEDSPHRSVGSAASDVLGSAAVALTGVEASSSARVVLAQILTATLLGFTRTSSVRDALPDTAPGSAEEALAVLAGIDHLRSSLAAMEVAWQVAAEQRIRRADAQRGVPASAQGKGANDEIALARRISPAASSFSLASARRLVQHMPGTVDALWEGALTTRQASTVADALSTASPATCSRIDEIIRSAPGTLHGKGHRRLRSDIEEMVQRFEPGTSRARAERAARQRHVTLTPLADGMARITAILRGIDAVGMMQSLQSGAEALRAAGEKTSVPALEADLLIDAVLHRDHAGDPPPAGEERPEQPGSETGTTAAAPARPVAPAAPADRSGPRPRRPRTTPGLDVGVVITDAALLGREDDAEVAHLAGYGIIPAHIVRDTMLGRPPGHLRHGEDDHPDERVSAVFRRLYTAPRPGDLVAMESRARAFPAGLARMIRWRDSTCRTPWCNARIRQSDHVVPHHRGGPTSYANGLGLCVRCNLLKERGTWVLAPRSREQVATGEPGAGSGQTPTTPATPPAAWSWTSPHGAQGLSWTPPMLAPPAVPAADADPRIHPSVEPDPPPQDVPPA